MKKKKLLVALLTVGCLCASTFAFSSCETIKKQSSEHVHAWETEYGYDNSYHWKKCTTCDETKKDLHTIVDSGECYECGQLIGETKGVLYEVVDGEACVVGYEGTYNRVRIAETYEGLPITYIGDEAFKDCDFLEEVVIPNSVTSIGVSTFSRCDNLKRIEIPENITSIGGSAFYNCIGLQGVYISDIEAWYNILFASEDSNPLKYAGNLYLNNKLLTELVISDDVTSIGDYTFCNCESLTKVVIGDNVTSIGKDAFYGCIGLMRLELGNKVESIDRTAFSGCYKLIEVLNHSPNITVEKGKGVGYYSLDVYNSGDDFTSGFSNDNGFIIYTYNEEKILVGYIGNDTDLTLPSYIKQIYKFAFYNCELLTSVKIPNGVTSIGHRAFENCINLIDIEISDSVISIGYDAFSNCNASAYNEYDKGNYIGNEKNPYMTLVSLKSKAYSQYEIHPNAKILINSVFGDCDSLTSIEIPNGVKIIGENAFCACDKLANVVIGDGVTSIGEEAFWVCRSLKRVVIGNSVTSIEASVFAGCLQLSEVVLGKSVASIGEDAFGECESLRSIEIPEGVTVIKERAFSCCHNLRDIVLPESLISIGDDVFRNILAQVYYKGSADQWEEILIGEMNGSLVGGFMLQPATRYYYIENEADVPTDGGNYWHYNEDGEIEVW